MTMRVGLGPLDEIEHRVEPSRAPRRSADGAYSARASNGSSVTSIVQARRGGDLVQPIAGHLVDQRRHRRDAGEPIRAVAVGLGQAASPPSTKTRTPAIGSPAASVTTPARHVGAQLEPQRPLVRHARPSAGSCPASVASTRAPRMAVMVACPSASVTATTSPAIDGHAGERARPTSGTAVVSMTTSRGCSGVGVGRRDEGELRAVLAAGCQARSEDAGSTRTRSSRRRGSSVRSFRRGIGVVARQGGGTQGGDRGRQVAVGTVQGAAGDQHALRRRRAPGRSSRGSRRRRPRSAARGRAGRSRRGARASSAARRAMKAWPPQPGWTVITSRRSTPSSQGMDGLGRRLGVERDARALARRARSPRSPRAGRRRPRRGRRSGRCPPRRSAPRRPAGRLIMRWLWNGSVVRGRTDSDDDGAHGQVVDEVAVHDVEVDRVDAAVVGTLAPPSPSWRSRR